jgi:hypothetical protein
MLPLPQMAHVCSPELSRFESPLMEFSLTSLPYSGKFYKIRSLLPALPRRKLGPSG